MFIRLFSDWYSQSALQNGRQTEYLLTSQYRDKNKCNENVTKSPELGGTIIYIKIYMEYLHNDGLSQ